MFNNAKMKKKSDTQNSFSYFPMIFFNHGKNIREPNTFGTILFIWNRQVEFEKIPDIGKKN